MKNAEVVNVKANGQTRSREEAQRQKERTQKTWGSKVVEREIGEGGGGRNARGMRGGGEGRRGGERGGRERVGVEG